MIAHAIQSVVMTAYESDDWSPAITRLKRMASSDDDALSDAIDLDAYARRINAVPVTLTFYLAALEDLPERESVFDTAIDCALQDLTRLGMPVSDAADKMIDDHPEHRDAIIRTACLTSLFDSAGLRSLINDEASEVPSELGPKVADGRRRYQIGAQIGSGSFGRVFEATDLRMGSDRAGRVAIKLLHAGETVHSEGFEEGRRLRSVRHPNVVTVYDQGVSDEGAAYLVMEYVEGSNLAEAGEPISGALTRDAFCTLADEMLSALGAMHKLGLLHADIKPANVLIDGGNVSSIPLEAEQTAEIGRVRLVDFGIARDINDGPWPGYYEDPETTAEGTPAFMAPELMNCGEPHTIASDLFSASRTLGTLLGGKASTWLRIGQDPLPQPAWADDRLRAILGRSASAEPDLRHESAAALARDLKRWRDGLSIEWLDRSRVRRAALYAKRKPATIALAAAMGLLATTGAVAGALALKNTAFMNAKAQLSADFSDLFTREDTDLRSYNGWRDWLTSAALMDRLSDSGAATPVINENESLNGQIAELQHGLAASERESESIEYQLAQANLVLLQLMDRQTHADTRERLESVVTWSTDRLDASDPLRDDLVLMGACLRIKEEVMARLADQAPLSRSLEFRLLHRRLENAVAGRLNDDRTPGERLGDPLTRLMARSLSMTSAKTWLDDAEARQMLVGMLSGR